jgi:hypothetical protein
VRSSGGDRSDMRSTERLRVGTCSWLHETAPRPPPQPALENGHLQALSPERPLPGPRRFPTGPRVNRRGRPRSAAQRSPYDADSDGEGARRCLEIPPCGRAPGLPSDGRLGCPEKRLARTSSWCRTTGRGGSRLGSPGCGTVAAPTPSATPGRHSPSRGISCSRWTSTRQCARPARHGPVAFKTRPLSIGRAPRSRGPTNSWARARIWPSGGRSRLPRTPFDRISRLPPGREGVPPSSEENFLSLSPAWIPQQPLVVATLDIS